MSKIFAQIILAGVQIVGRAFADAYRQAAANAVKNGASASASGGSKSGGRSAISDLTRKTGISFEEASRILNVDKSSSSELLKKNYEHLFTINDKKNGGSFYLQSKVVRAKERIDMEKALEKNCETEQGPKGGNDTQS